METKNTFWDPGTFQIQSENGVLLTLNAKAAKTQSDFNLQLKTPPMVCKRQGGQGVVEVQVEGSM